MWATPQSWHDFGWESCLRAAISKEGCGWGVLISLKLGLAGEISPLFLKEALTCSLQHVSCTVNKETVASKRLYWSSFLLFVFMNSPVKLERTENFLCLSKAGICGWELSSGMEHLPSLLENLHLSLAHAHTHVHMHITSLPSSYLLSHLPVLNPITIAKRKFSALIDQAHATNSQGES